MSEPLHQSLHRSPSQLFVTESKKIHEDDFIGEGHFGSVYKAHHKDWGVVAIKHLFSSTRLSEKEKKDLVSEADKMNTVKCTYIVNLFGVVLEPANYSLVVEYMKYKSLNDFQAEYINPWAMKIRMIYNIILGMNYLHTTAKMVHRDLKIDNVMVGEGFIAKVGDFGLAMWMKYTRKYTKKSKQTSSQGAAGTISHIAPECLSNINYKADYKCDVYGFAVTLWEIITEEEPYAEAQNSAQIHSCIVNGQRPDESEIPAECPEFLIKMMKDCWDDDSTKRPSFGGLKDVIEQELKNYEQEIQSAVMILQKQEEQKMNPNTMTSGQNPVHQPSEECNVTQVTEDMARATLQSSGPQPLVSQHSGLHSGLQSGQPSGQHSGQQSGQHVRGQDEGNSPGQNTVTDAGPESVNLNKNSPTSSSKSFRQPHQETKSPGPYQVDAASSDNIAKGVSQGQDQAFGKSTTIQAGKHGNTTITISGQCSGVQIGDGNIMHVGGAMGMPRLPTVGLQPQPTKQKPKYKISTSTTLLTEDDLEDLSPHIGENFPRLGRKLGFSNGELDGFKHDYGSSGLREVNFRMLYEWKQRKGKEATRGKLATHLCEIKLYYIAQRLPYT